MNMFTATVHISDGGETGSKFNISGAKKFKKVFKSCFRMIFYLFSIAI